MRIKTLATKISKLVLPEGVIEVNIDQFISSESTIHMTREAFHHQFKEYMEKRNTQESMEHFAYISGVKIFCLAEKA